VPKGLYARPLRRKRKDDGRGEVPGDIFVLVEYIRHLAVKMLTVLRKCQSNTIDETIFRFCWKHFFKLLHIIFNTNPWFKISSFMGRVFIQLGIGNNSSFHIFVVVYISFSVTTLHSYPPELLKTTPNFVLDWAPPYEIFPRLERSQNSLSLHPPFFLIRLN
jgi:hypothetical protein